MIVRKEVVSKTMQVFVLENETRIEIKKMLELELKKYYCGNELDEYIENGMDSRLCDLEDTIDIHNIAGLEVK